MRKKTQEKKAAPNKVYQPNNQKSRSVAKDVFSLRRRRRRIAKQQKKKRHASPAEESNQNKQLG
jgi:hypothetical protein